MILTQKSRLTVLPSTQNVARALAWLVAALFLLNALYFVLRASSPVIRDDSWYFLDVFLRKAINGDRLLPTKRATTRSAGSPPANGTLKSACSVLFRSPGT